MYFKILPNHCKQVCLWGIWTDSRFFVVIDALYSYLICLLNLYRVYVNSVLLSSTAVFFTVLSVAQNRWYCPTCHI